MENSNTEVTEAGNVEGASAPSTDGPSVEDMAAHDYQKLLPEFVKAMEVLPKKRATRVFRALMEYPLENQRPHLPYTDEKQAFYLGMQVLDCKFVIQRAVLELAKDKEEMRKFNAEVEQMRANKESGA